ncbi:MAG: GntR family transcriptional regulator [Peptococcaceae bacterium]|nr:GntR family transcriptional regulator [Peptococcaceae bacterium]
MEFQANIPIYLQLIDMVKMQIVSGTLKPGEKLKSVRELAMEYGVNPNTMQKALAELENEELLYTMRTAGRYVTEDELLISRLREQQARERIGQFLEELSRFGYSKQEIKVLLDCYMEERLEDGSTGGI